MPDSSDAEAGNMFGPITCVTVTAPDLKIVEACYTRFLGFRVAGRGQVSEQLAGLWRCPDESGQDYLLLAPEAGDDFVFRFIEHPDTEPFMPFSTYGWNAAEIIVKDVDALAGVLADSPFQIIGEPQNLSFSDDIRAMQVLGPGQELLYLTEFKKPVPGLDTPTARCDVDKVFIMILGGPSMDELQGFFGNRFGVPGAPSVESRVKGMSAAFGNSPEHKYLIAALPLNGQAFIEVDEMPAQAAPRPNRQGQLPAGISMVSFTISGQTEGLEAIDSAALPYGNGGRAACLTGSAGELIELIAAE
jgi:hypothetical protein